MSDGHAALQALIARMRSLRGLPEAAAVEAAPLIADAVRSTAAAGQTPEGIPWPAKKEGGRALVHAADHVTVTAAGPTVTIALEGVDVYHQHGVGRTIPKRQIIPDAGTLPISVVAAAIEGANRAFARLSGGA